MSLHFLHKQKKVNFFARLTDEELISLYKKTRNGDLIAELFERYTHLVYGICLGYIHDRDICKDAVMEIFESLFEKLLKHEIINFKNWLFSVAKNHCLMSIRKNAAGKRLMGVLLEELQHDTDKENNEQSAQELEMLRMTGDTEINNAVSQLKEEQNKCIRMLYHEEKSYKEISEQTGYSIPEVKSFIQNGKRNLKNILINHYGRK